MYLTRARIFCVSSVGLMISKEENLLYYSHASAAPIWWLPRCKTSSGNKRMTLLKLVFFFFFELFVVVKLIGVIYQLRIIDKTDYAWVWNVIDLWKSKMSMTISFWSVRNYYAFAWKLRLLSHLHCFIDVRIDWNKINLFWITLVEKMSK